MEHSAYKEMLSALLDGELDSAEREAALAHLETCAACRAYFAELTALRAALGDLEEFDAPEGFAAGVTARLRAGDEITRPRGENASETHKRRVPRRGFAALAACAAVVLLAVHALPNALRMGSGGNNAAADSAAAGTALYAAPSSAPDAPGAPASEPQYQYSYAGGSAGTDSGNGALTEGAPAENESETGASMSSVTGIDRMANDDLEDAVQNDDAAKAPANEKQDEKLPIANGAEVPMQPLSRPEAWGEEYPVLTLSGEGAESWLAEHGWQGESGSWYAGAAALRALPEGLTVLYSELTEDYEGAVLVELWEAEP